MSKTTFTPGPWLLECSDNATPHILHMHHDNPETNIDDHDQIVCIMPAEIKRSYNSFPNARLIAAAPEMYELLNSLQDYEILLEQDRKAIQQLLNRINNEQ